ncbi:uncharacterized protein LOC132169448 [Corylus avellana]|uniref:uncharacterized protein LOC132169448 n=1 Tax=Corylus avellana TaxID=13451 RepID=UPI00286B2F84|nr:uncharacterized protein LOC132169448 [Corylus avellana]
MGNSSNDSNGKSKRRAMTIAIAAPIVIFASIFVAWAFVRKKRKNIQRFPTRSTSMGALHGGKMALHRLADYREARENAATLDRAETELKNLLEEEKLDFEQLQRTVAKLEMSGKEDDAVEVLEKAVKVHEEKQQEAYEIQMLLVEMLIYKGDFEKAFNFECLKHEEIADARRPLYKGIINIMLGHPEQAKKCWEDFKDIQRHFQWPPSLGEDTQVLDNDITDFKEFENIVKLLKDDIYKADAKKKQK